MPRGETAGAVLLLEDVMLQAGERDLIESASWKMMPGQRVGLVGANGAGKSTLLKAIAGLRNVDAGQLLVAPSVSVGYLAQTAVSGSTKTVYEEARGAMTALAAAEAALAAAQAAAERGEATAAQQLADAQEAFEAAGGYDADRRIGMVLDGLGFRREQWDWSCERFSGGWQMRIALARMLLSPAGQTATGSGAGDAGGGLLLLDEPTNHLDAAAVSWLASFLASSGGSLVLVSHDEALLQGACDRIVEVRGRRLHHYVGSYRKFLEQREERATLAAATAASQAAEIKRLEDFVARFGAKASKAAEAQSKLKVSVGFEVALWFCLEAEQAQGVKVGRMPRTRGTCKLKVCGRCVHCFVSGLGKSSCEKWGRFEAKVSKLEDFVVGFGAKPSKAAEAQGTLKTCVAIVCVAWFCLGAEHPQGECGACLLCSVLFGEVLPVNSRQVGDGSLGRWQCVLDGHRLHSLTCKTFW